ncbi:GNAT family protein [soil metagenome]
MHPESEPGRNRELNIDPVLPLPPAVLPSRTAIEGRSATVEPLDARKHGSELYAASHDRTDAEQIWTYLPYGAFPSLDSYEVWLRSCSAAPDPLFFAIRDHETGKASGLASLMSIEPLHGSIEIGHIMLGLPLQNTVAGTEGLYLLMKHAMDDLGNRRLEWKCDAMNEPSRRAARRLGFAFEGVFDQHRIVKGRNRDTAWYSILDSEWPQIQVCFAHWLDRANFDENGRQKTSLSTLTKAFRDLQVQSLG